jgi:hypothetical protein
MSRKGWGGFSDVLLDATIVAACVWLVWKLLEMVA